MAVHSKDGQRWLTKLKRISALVTKHPEMTFNNIGHIMDIEMLRELYRQLNGKKAVGIDKVSKVDYGKHLDENLKNLLIRIRRGVYKPKAARIVEIPKEDGSKRPLAISCIEDKLVQLAVQRIMDTLFEPSFLPCSFGGRANRSAHDALRALTQSTYENPKGAIVEIDIRKYFNSIPHTLLMRCIEEKIADKRFLGLVRTLIKNSAASDRVLEKRQLLELRFHLIHYGKLVFDVFTDHFFTRIINGFDKIALSP